MSQRERREKKCSMGGIPSQYHALQRLFDHFKDCKVKVAYEAGPCGFWLYDKLTEDGIETIVVPPWRSFWRAICSRECMSLRRKIGWIGNF
jgi:hypothetical protein